MNCYSIASVKNVIRNAFFVSSLVILSVVGASAQSTTVTPPAASVSYLGTSNEQLSFLMNYDNETAEKFVVSIVNKDGDVLFEGVYADKKFSKTFKLPTDAGNVSFSISSFRNKSEKKFLVTTERRITEEVVILKP
jgi:hypothetical protein